MAAEKIDALELNIQSKLSVENLDKLIASLNKLGKACKNTNGKKAADDIKGIGDSSKQAAGGIEQFLGKAVRITAVIALFKKAGGVIGDSVAKTLTYNKTLNMFTVSLGEYATNATKYGNTVKDALGIDIAGWQNAQGIFQTLITGFGVSGDQAAYMSQNLTQLSYDIASFYNLTNEEAQNKLKSAISGRLEPIRKLGWDLSQSKLVDIAKNPKYYGEQTYSINEQTGAIESNTRAVDDNTQHKIVNFNQLTQQEKVQLRYIALMTQVTQVQGNYARALNDPANQMKIFKEQTEMTSRALGNIFIPMLNAALPYLTAFAQLAEQAFNAIAKWFGYEMPDMSERMNIAPVAEPYNDVVQATGRAAGNAKKLKDYMLGIDELNVLRKPDDTAGGGGGRVGENSNLSNLLTPGYDFLSKAISNSIEQAKKDIELLRKDFKQNPLKLTGTILFEGGRELGAKLWELILGKSPDELAADAKLHGNTLADEFKNAFKNKIAENGSSIVEMVFGSPDEMGERAARAGRTVGEQFGLELLKKVMEVVQATGGGLLYKMITNNDIGKDIDKINNLIDNKATEYTKSSSHTHSAKVFSSGRGGSTPIELPSVSLGNTAADEARKAGERIAKAYAEGIGSGKASANTAGTSIYNNAINGANNNGKGGQMFGNTAANEAYKYAMGLTSSKAKSEAYVGGMTLANQGVRGSTTYNNNKDGFGYAGAQSGAGYVAGVNNKTNLTKAKSAGATIASNALKKLKEVLGIHSPSRAFGEAGMYSVEGYAQYMERYSYLASNAAKDMANSALKAVETANSAIGGGASVPTSTNAGYGVGVANEGAMMSLASNIYQAVVSGMAAAGGNNGGDLVLVVDGKELFRVVRNQERKSGIAIGNGAFA